MVTYSKKVLVVDDDPDIREIISLILDIEGFTVCGLDNGREVLDRIQSCRPDLILLDVMLGDCDGRDICKVLRIHLIPARSLSLSFPPPTACIPRTRSAVAPMIISASLLI